MISAKERSIMVESIIISTYIILVPILIGAEIYVLSNDKGKYLRNCYKGLKSILKIENISKDTLAKEIELFYFRYSQEKPGMKKFFPNVITWIDAIIIRIDLNYGYANEFKENVILLKEARDILAEKYPYSKCENYQQDILLDIEKLKTHENESIVYNILRRIEDEFLKLSSDNKKNKRSSTISTLIGVIGILVSILIGLIKF